MLTRRSIENSQLQLVEFSSRWYIRGWESQHVLHSVPQKCSQCCFWNSSNVGLTDDSPFSSYQGRSWSAFSLYTSLLKVIDGVMSLALCPEFSQAPQHSRISQDASHLWWFLSSPANLLSQIARLQDSTPAGVFEAGCRTFSLACLGFSFHFSLYLWRQLVSRSSHL